MKPVVFRNPINNEKLLCENIRNVKIIDGVEYVTVRKQNQRVYLMRKDALVREVTK